MSNDKSKKLNFIRPSDLVEAMQWRYATKTFDTSRKIPAEDVDALLESLRLSASSFGLQPWKFIIIENKELREKIKSSAYGQSQVTDASHLVLFCATKKMTPEMIDHFVSFTAKTRGVPSASLDSMKNMIVGATSSVTPEQSFNWMAHQTYLAFGSFLTSCAVCGIDACPMEGFDAAAVNKLLDLDKQDLQVLALCPIGYRSPTDKYAGYAKVRFNKEDVFIFK